MFGNIKNLMSLMGNAKELRAKFEEMQAELAKKTVEGEAGAGAVRVTVNGKLDVMRVQLDPAMVATLAGEGSEADLEMVEELIKSATNAAMEKARKLIQSEASEAAGGLNIPGLESMLGG